MGTGYEPVVNCDRRVLSGDMNKRIQLVWMDPMGMNPGIDWAISHALGAPSTWGTPVVFASGQYLDPVAACDIWSADTTRQMYFGWYAALGTGFEADFRRSTSGTSVDQSTVMQSGGGERPWLAANTASLYLSFAEGKVKRAAVPSGAGFVDWSGPAILVFTADPNTAIIHNFPVATHRDSAGSERVFVMAREYGLPMGCTKTLS